MTTQDAIYFFGSVRLLAQALGITTQAVYAWGDAPPLAAQYQLHVLSDGVLQAPPAKTKEA